MNINLSAPFILRPVMTFLVMISIAFFGILAYKALPVSDLPNVDYPTILVSVEYPGADPETIANNVVVPLEREFATIEGIQVIASTSYTGNASIVLQFHLNRNIDLAAPDVQAAINAAGPHLPQNLPYAPTYSKVNPTASPILFLILTSPTETLADLYDYGNTVLGERLSIVEGVAQVQTYGSPFSVRLRVDPQKLAARKIGLNEVGQAIRQANVYLPTGTLYGSTGEFTINVAGQLTHAEEYNRIIVKNDKGSIVRFEDIGTAIDSIQYDKMTYAYCEKEGIEPMVALAIRKQPGANTLSIIQNIKEILPALKQDLPGSVKVVPMYDQSEYIQESIHDVEFTLILALILVTGVVFMYLGKVKDTLIPVIAIPMSILGTLIVMFYLGFSIDILSLLAFTLVIGFLVDDAIVVLENIVRLVEEGKKPLEAALEGSKQIDFTILSMTCCLAIVFIPLLFMEGIIGKILHQFSCTIIVAVLISGFISLTLTPLLASRLIPPFSKDAKKHKIELFAEKFNAWILKIYAPTLEWALNHKKTILLSGLASLGLSVFLILSLPKDFLPEDDLGLIDGFVQTTDGTSPFLIGDYTQEIMKILSQDENVESVAAVGGYPKDNEAVLFIRLKPLSQRLGLTPLLKHLYQKANVIPGVKVFLKPLPLLNLQVGALESKGNYQYTLQGFHPEEIYAYGSVLEKKLKHLPQIKDVVSDLDITQPQLHIDILRDRASLYNVSAFDIENALSLGFANSNLSPINTPHNQYYVIMETLPEFYKDPSKLKQLWIRSSTGGLVPLSSITKMTEKVGPLTVNHINGLPSATISFNLNNAPLDTALAAIEAIANETLPPTVHGFVQGSANVFKTSFANLDFLLVITFFLIYVILGILYENFFPPLTVMSTLPPAMFGGLVTLILFGQTFSLYAFVGLILLLGIVLKNGIILIDFANESRIHHGKSIHDAIYHASLVRIRPILMTTFAALMGAVPIAFGLGGMTAQGRKPLGLVIVGGLIFSQIMTLYLTPVVYIYIEKLHEKLTKKREREEQQPS